MPHPSSSILHGGRPAVCLLLLLSLLMTSCSMLDFLRFRPEHKLRDYEGRWYVIARMPNRFEEGLICTTTTYSFSDDGMLTVINAGRERNSGRVTSLTSRVWVPDLDKPDIFRVQLFFTITRDFRLVYMDESKDCAIIGSMSGYLMWIICRNPAIDDDRYQALVKEAAANGYDTSRLIPVEQSCWQ